MPVSARTAPCVAALLAAVVGCKGREAEPASAPTAARPASPETSSAGVAPTATPPAALPADPGGAGGKHMWSTRIGGTAAESGRGIAVDGAGGVYVTGLFRDKLELGAGPALEAERVDGFLARLGPDGAVQWARRLGGKNDDIADAVAVDPQGNAIVAGAFSDRLAIGDGALAADGADDLFVTAFDPKGSRLWAKRIGGVDVDAADGVAVAANGSIAVIGVFAGYVDIGGGHELVGAGESDILLAVLEPTGAVRWARGWGGPAVDEGRAVGFDRQGNLYVLVEFSREVDFGGGPLVSGGNRDLGLIKLDPSGRHLWSRRFGSQLDELAVGLAVDPAGSVIVTGSFDDVLDLGDGAMRTAGRSDVFVAKFAPDGHVQWSRRFGNTDEDIGAGVATDRYGNVYAVGWYWKRLELTGSPLVSAGKKDMFLAVLSPAGDPLWARSFGGAEDDYARGVAVDDDAVYLTGTFHKTMQLGDKPLVAAEGPAARLPLGDAFAAKLTR